MVVASNKYPKGSKAGGQAKAAWDALLKAKDFFGLKQIEELVNQGIKLEVGKDVSVTTVGNEFYTKTDCKALLHVAGPDCRISAEYYRRNELLQSAYYNAVLKAFKEASMLTPSPQTLRIAFPMLSIGIFNYPVEEFMHYCLCGLSQVDMELSFPIIIDLYMFKTHQTKQLLNDFKQA
jgi:O-acetyl-ADP-ribose deacetylase (regulator of RNase III)